MDLTIDITQQVEIAAGREAVWNALTEGTHQWFNPPGGDLRMRLEPRPGGRLFRDLGDDAGHLWGHVQVIKPPYLLEIIGPLAVSNASISHVAFRLEEAGDKTLFRLTHRAVGHMAEDYRTGFADGWRGMMEGVKNHVERR